MSPWVKVCGLTGRPGVEAALAAGADALGFNCVPSSPRYLSPARLRALLPLVQDRAEVVLVGVAGELDYLLALRRELGIPCTLQIHGDPGFRPLPEASYLALPLGGESDLEVVRKAPGERIQVDARHPTLAGGTGRRARWDLAARLARERRLILAGGLDSACLGAALGQVDPWGVDVASGVESAPGREDPALVEAFVTAARAAPGGEG